jgi:hypothetical protein
MAPFLDPGATFEQAEIRGYIVHAKTLAEYRAAGKRWASMLNYETRWMTRVYRWRDGRGCGASRRSRGELTRCGEGGAFPAASFLRNSRVGTLRLVS